LQVFDDEGKDVTPRPLFHPDPDPAVRPHSRLSAASASFGATGSGFLSSLSTQHTLGVNAASISESVPDGSTEPGSRRDTTISSPDVQARREAIKEELTEEELDKRVDIYLTETETIWILDMPSVVVSTESEDAARILERNRVYIEICKTRPGNDRFVEKTVQTINGAAKNKEVQCDKIIMEDKGMTVTSWDLYNSFNTSETEPTSKAEGSRAAARTHEEKKCQPEAVLTSENFQQTLFFTERILMENIFQPKLAAYRQFPVLTDPDVTPEASGTVAAVEDAEQEKHEKAKKDKKEQKEALMDPSVLADLNESPEEIVPPTLERLWSYRCDLTDSHSVSSMAWSKVNPDLLAVGYGAFDFKEQKQGLACCWSLKNPMWPERIFHCEHGVTAVDFSMTSPNLLAVGMYNGSVAIYDVRSRKDTALLDSRDSSNKHTGPVWELRWVEQDRGDGKKERLICISSDGRVTEWFIQNRLDCTDLMKIRRTESEKKKLPSEKERKSESLISQRAAGMCFDFHPKDANLYLAGTEGGHIHKCSCSCSEQFLETYRGHKGPVYKVAWNPFSTDVFLSCSADGSIMLWHQESQAPILTFSSTNTFVHDITWSPKSAGIFAAASESRVDIWDLSVSVFYPVISSSANPRAKFTSVHFAENTDCLLMGDSEGEVGVFELQNLRAPGSSKVGFPRERWWSLAATAFL
ncbi:WDR78 protein, partial [Aegotheles bennettii]|nr:WDR78 protein [Aegotheles bennettii]